MFKKKKLDKEKAGFVTGALNWMYENEIFETPVLNNLYGNIYSISKQIRDVELLIDKNTRKMMVYIKLGILGRLFENKIKKVIVSGILEVLPKFKVRVVTDKNLFNKALVIVKSNIGGTNEDSNSNNDSSDSDESDTTGK